MRSWRSLEFRLACWYSLVLLAGLTFLGSLLWFGVNYSMVAAVDDHLAARVRHLVDFVDSEFGGNLHRLGRNERGEIEGEIEQVDPRREWLVVNGNKLRVTENTSFEGYADPQLMTGQYVDVAVKKGDTGDWLAIHIELEAGFWENLQEDLSGYASSIPEGSLIYIRTDGNRALLPVRTVPDQQEAVPWQGRTKDGNEFFTVETESGPFRILATAANLAGHGHQIQVASSLAAVSATKERLISWLLWIVPTGLLLSASGGYFISRTALKPVEKIVGIAGNIDVRGLSRRLDVPATGDVVQELAETFNRMLTRLETSVRRLEEFTADASHELRTPVSVIRTTAELALRQPRTRQELREDMQQVESEATRLSQLIEDLLTLARADNGDGTLPMSAVDLGALVHETTTHYGRTFAQRNLQVEIPETDAVLAGHAPSLTRLLLILLDNAIRHTPPDALVRVAVREEGESLILSVTDTGEGISPDDLKRIFDRFYRANTSRTRSKGGFGLGLSIAKWIVQSHGGSITATSQVAEGTTISARLPRQGGPPIN